MAFPIVLMFVFFAGFTWLAVTAWLGGTVHGFLWSAKKEQAPIRYAIGTLAYSLVAGLSFLFFLALVSGYGT